MKENMEADILLTSYRTHFPSIYFDHSDKKRDFLQEVLILLNGCTTWMLKKRMDKKLDRNHTTFSRVILKKIWK